MVEIATEGATTDPVLPPLPTWTDAASVTTYITSVVSVIVGIVTLVHPGFHEPSDAQTLLPIVGFLIAGVAQLVNVVEHRSVQKAAIHAGMMK